MAEYLLKLMEDTKPQDSRGPTNKQKGRIKRNLLFNISDTVGKPKVKKNYLKQMYEKK